MEIITELIKRDPLRQQALKVVAHLQLPQCFVAAGFIRNLIWDHLHNKSTPTPLNDVDVVYFDAKEQPNKQNLYYEHQLKIQLPSLNWQVRNQATMHTRNGDLPYKSTLDAMSYWPEKETAVGVRLNKNGEYEFLSAFGLEALLDLNITHNPKRSLDTFEKRIADKDWLTHWPKLNVKRQY